MNIDATGAPDVPTLPSVSKHAYNVASKESVATEILAWAKRRIMSNSLNKKELQNLLEAARAAGRAEGYAQARLEMALERAEVLPEAPKTDEVAKPATVGPQTADFWRAEAEKADEKAPYTTRTTMKMTRAIALDYLKTVSPRIVGPSEIKKNSEKAHGLFISFGTLKRAMESLTEAGEVEQIEPSRWRYKGRPDAVMLKSVR